MSAPRAPAWERERYTHDKLKCGVIKCEKNKNKSHELGRGESAQNVSGGGVSRCSVKIYVITTSGHTHSCTHKKHVEIDHTIYYVMCANNNGEARSRCKEIQNKTFIMAGSLDCCGVYWSAMWSHRRRRRRTQNSSKLNKWNWNG